MTPPFEPGALPRRLRALREKTWPGHSITQRQLAEAFSAERPTSVPLVASWESLLNSNGPPRNRLDAYARFFATERSVGDGGPRPLSVEELTAAERARYVELLDELNRLKPGSADHTVPRTAPGLWHFPEGGDILIVCARRPAGLAGPMGRRADPDAPDYVDLYSYEDGDALIELFGHLRAVNPSSAVRFTTADRLQADDYTRHLVLLGAVDLHVLSGDLLPWASKLPVRQIARDGDSLGGFEVRRGDDHQLFAPTVLDGILVEDVALFDRRPSPFHHLRTVTTCNGMFGRGVYGAVRAFTDVKFKARNEEYARSALARTGAFGLLTRVQVIGGTVVTPDWSMPGTVLCAWPAAD